MSDQFSGSPAKQGQSPAHPRWALRSLPIALTLALMGCAADRDHSNGMSEMSGGDREKGLALLSRASQAEPTNSQFRLDYLQQQALAERDVINRADEARRAGRLDEAKRWYQLALRVNSASDRAVRGLAGVEMDARHVTVLNEIDADIQADKLDLAEGLLHKVIMEDPGNVTAQKMSALLTEKQEAKEQAEIERTAASSVMKKPVALQFRDANLRMVFEGLSRTTGLNVIFDRDVKPDLKTTIFVHDASVEETVDMILMQNQLDKKVLNANTLFIYPGTPAKQKEYQDLKIRVFQLSNVEGKYMQGLFKSMLKGVETSLDEKANTLVVRGTPDVIAVAEKLVAAHDLPDAEVMLEVEVLEVSRDRLTDLGIQWPSQLALATPGASSSSGSGSSGGLTLQTLRHTTLNSLNVNGLSATINASLTDTDTNILASPRIRVRDKQKAKILIGNKVPVFTQSITPTAGTSPISATTITYLDVGIKMEVEPHVYREGDVGINMNIDVSNIVKQITDPTGTSTAYEIGSRSTQTSLRLRDGETQILAGLINDQTNVSANEVPGLGQFPILDHLFGNQNREHSKDEVVLSITPHVLRAPAIADRHVRDLFSGTETTVKQHPIRLDPVGTVGNAAPSPASGPNANAAPASVAPGFVGGGGGGASGQMNTPASGSPAANNLSLQHRARPVPLNQSPAVAGKRPGDPGVYTIPTQNAETEPTPEAPAPAEQTPAAAVEATPAPAPAPVPAPAAPAAPTPPPAVGGAMTPSSF